MSKYKFTITPPKYFTDETQNGKPVTVNDSNLEFAAMIIADTGPDYDEELLLAQFIEIFEDIQNKSITFTTPNHHHIVIERQAP